MRHRALSDLGNSDIAKKPSPSRPQQVPLHSHSHIHSKGATMVRSAFLLCLFCMACALPAADKKPNIVFILADDLGYADVSFNGRKEWPTPNLHRLTLEGTIFRRWYTAAVVCAPSRAALMTGRYGIHNGVTGNNSLDLPDSEITIAAAL